MCVLGRSPHQRNMNVWDVLWLEATGICGAKTARNGRSSKNKGELSYLRFHNRKAVYLPKGSSSVKKGTSRTVSGSSASSSITSPHSPPARMALALALGRSLLHAFSWDLRLLLWRFFAFPRLCSLAILSPRAPCC